MAYNIKAITLNVQGLRSITKRRSLFHYFQNHCKDSIIYLQETHSTPEIESVWRNEWGSDIHFCHFTTNSRGVCILIPKELDFKIDKIIRDDEGRFLIVSINMEATQFILANIYAPTKGYEAEQCEFLDRFRENMQEFIGENVLLGGDFNMTIYPGIDKSGGRDEGRSKYRNSLIEFIEEFGLCDIWREKNPGVRHYTWSSPDGNIKSRLDFWLIPNFLIPNAKKTNITPIIKTDHRACTLHLHGDLFQKRGPGFYKFNSDLLRDMDYIKMIKQTIQNCKVNYADANPAILWELAKCDIRRDSINFLNQKIDI